MGGVAGGFDVGSSGGLRVGMRPGDLPRPSPGALAFLVQASAALSEVRFPPLFFLQSRPINVPRGHHTHAFT